MPRIADVLERESRTVDLEQGDFERLLGRRERKQRNRRIRAGAVGVIVALATGIVLVRSLTSDRDPGGSARRAPAGAGGVGHPRVRPRRRHLRRRSGRVERGQDRGRRPATTAPPPTGSVLGRGSMWSPDGRYLAYRRRGLLQPGRRLGGRRDHRRGGQRARDVPRRRMGHRVVARFLARRGVGHPVRDGRRLRGRRRPAGAGHDAVRMATVRRSRPGVAAGRDVGG